MYIHNVNTYIKIYLPTPFFCSSEIQQLFSHKAAILSKVDEIVTQGQDGLSKNRTSSPAFLGKRGLLLRSNQRPSYAATKKAERPITNPEYDR